MTQDIHLNSLLSNDTVSVGSVSGHTVDLGDGWDRLDIHGNVSNGAITGAAGSGLDAAHTDVKEIFVDGTLLNSSINLGAGHDQVYLHSVSGSNIQLGGGDDALHINGNISGSTFHGGAGSDILDLGSGTHNNVTLAWDAGDAGIGNHATDTVEGFKAGTGSSADTLDVRDLLADIPHGSGSVNDMLSFTVANGSTTIHINADNGSGHEVVQNIVLSGVELNHASSTGTYEELAHQINLITGG